MQRKTEPWYIHAVLMVIIAILTYILIRVAIIDPSEVVANEKRWKTESRLRMSNLKQAQMLFEDRHKQFTDNLEELVSFLKTDSKVAELIEGWDSVRNASTNPFDTLLMSRDLSFDSLFTSPKSLARYIMSVDTSIQIDTVINRRGTIVSIDTLTEIGKLYEIICPDGYGKIGDTKNQALKNSSTWE
ncbi:MAG: hypothetical protein KKA84_02125 [Bacteroidetes bacterium]|nr:hypothetical protein [Bacteroidota bacterium]